jgi:hypothetical protein
VLVGGELPAATTVGQFYPPTVIVDVTADMRLMTEEVFGPVLPVVKVKTDAEAVAVANNCKFGLGSSVFSASQVRESLNVTRRGVRLLCWVLATVLARRLGARDGDTLAAGDGDALGAVPGACEGDALQWSVMGVL